MQMQPQGQIMAVTVPPGVPVGGSFLISTPDGQQMQVQAQVPEGQQMQIQVPAPAMTAATQVMARDLPPGVPPGCTCIQNKYWGPTSQLISLALLPCAGCLCPCLIPCDTREAYLMPGVTNHNGAKYVNKDECSHCGMGKCAAGTWQYEAEKKGSSGGGA